MPIRAIAPLSIAGRSRALLARAAAWSGASRLAVAAVLAVAAYRIAVLLPYSATPTLYPDSHSYLRLPPFGELLTSLRPPLVPLVYAFLGQQPETIALFQLGLSVLGWSLLAGAVYRFAGGAAAGLGGALGILALSLHGSVSQWEHILLAESLSTSLMALLLAAAFEYGHRERVAVLVGFVAAAALWSFTRELNAHVSLVVAGALLLPGVRRRPLRHGLALACVAAVLGLAIWSSERAGRWVYPFYNVMCRRILTSPEATAFFSDRGMPTPEALALVAGTWAGSSGRYIFVTPNLAGWRAWVREDGRRVYALYLVRHPVYTATPLVAEFGAIYAPELRYHWRGPAFTPPLGAGLDRALASPWLPLTGLVLALVAAVRAPPQRRVLPAALVALSIPLGLALWHADPRGIPRHCQPVSVLLKIGIVTALAGWAGSSPSRSAPSLEAAPIASEAARRGRDPRASDRVATEER